MSRTQAAATRYVGRQASWNGCVWLANQLSCFFFSQISNFLNRLREQSVVEGEANNKEFSRPSRPDAGRVSDASPSASPLPAGRGDSGGSGTGGGSSNVLGQLDPTLDAVANMSIEDLQIAHNKGKRSFFEHSRNKGHLFVPIPMHGSIGRDKHAEGMKLAPSYRAVEEDEKHQQPIEVMSDYESRLIKKEALRNPLAEAEPDEDTPAGLRRRQLCFNLGNPYKKNATKVRKHSYQSIRLFILTSFVHAQQSSNVYQGEAADEAAALGGQSPKRQRTRKRSSQLKRERKQARRSHRPPNSPSLSSSPGSPSRSPTSSPSSMSSGTASITSSPGLSDTGDSVMTTGDSMVGSNYSVKAEAAQMLGIPLHEGETPSDGDKPIFVRQVYGVLVENWESWSAILRLIKARTTTQQVRFHKGFAV